MSALGCSLDIVDNSTHLQGQGTLESLLSLLFKVTLGLEQWQENLRHLLGSRIVIVQKTDGCLSCSYLCT